MNGKNAQFYFANLAADIARCVTAAKRADEERYEESLSRARKTLSLLRAAGRPEAYEEGLLLLLALALAHKDATLDRFLEQLNNMTSAMSIRLLAGNQ